MQAEHGTTPADALALVVDLEATCDSQGKMPREEMEIIEIGAVLVRMATDEIIDEFQEFVRPVKNPQLTEFCRELTSISQDQVDAAPAFRDALARFQEWMFRDGRRPRFCSWGAYDRKQFAQDCRYHEIEDPMPRPHYNLKVLFSEQQGLGRRRYGLKQALYRVGLELTGTHHRGIDDARNIARLLPYCFPPCADESPASPTS